jgi:DNA-binding PadR family transcriptional regulator
MQVRLLVLYALAHGPKHGYQIARHLDERTGGICAVSFGALYPVLHRLEADGLARAGWQRDDDTGKRKKVYALTRAGAAALAEEQGELDRLVAAVRRLAEAAS